MDMSDRRESPSTLVELFEATAARHPDRNAVSDGEQTLTYRELGRRSHALAAHLVARGIGREDRVVVHRTRSSEVFVALLGILKAGATHVSVDIRYPDKRRDLMVDGGSVPSALPAKHLSVAARPMSPGPCDGG